MRRVDDDELGYDPVVESLALIRNRLGRVRQRFGKRESKTIVELAGSETIGAAQIAEAVQYRPRERI